MDDQTNAPQFRPGGSDGSRKQRLARKAEGEKNLARMQIGVGYLLIFISVLVAISTFFEIHHKADLENHGVRTTGTVVDVTLNQKSKGDPSTQCFSVNTTVSYVSNDKIARTIKNTNNYCADKISEISPDYRIGDSIEVFYNPEDPSDYLVPKWDEGRYLMLILPLSLFLFGMFNIHLGKNYELYRTIWH